VTLAGTALGLASAAALVGCVAGFVLPRRSRVVVATLATALVGTGATAAGLGVLLTGDHVTARWPEILPLAGVTIDLDPLGAWFVLAAGAVIVPVAVYAYGYCDHALTGRAVQGLLPVFAATLVLVPAAGSMSTFLVLWELMAMSSLVLVAAEHGDRPAVRQATVWYGVMTQLGFVAILIAFGLAAAGTGHETFAAIRHDAPTLSAARASTIFVLALAGFGSKAGLVPLHVWLPRAHPEAPSHVSALMSGAMVSLGAYGVVRVAIDLLGGGPRWWGVLVLALGVASALFGILHALVASDLKVLLAYSTTENMGLVFVGIGAAVLLAAVHEPALAGVALAAALLWVLNHAVFKALLFLAAGSIARSTGTRDLDRLGGLMKRLPVTATMFTVGALAIAGLPPLNGFVSEWALFQTLVRAGGRPPDVLGLTMPMAVGAVALTAGLAAATFVKAIGTGMLAMPRSPEAERAVESPVPMLAGMSVLASACLVLGLVPGLLASGLGRAVRAAGGRGEPLGSGVAELRLAGARGVISPVLLAVALLVGLVLVLGVARALGGSRARRRAENWGCGRVLQTARMEYTAISFAEPLQRVFSDVLHPQHDIDVTHAAESRWYVEAVQYRASIADGIDERAYQPAVGALRWWGERARALQNGSVHRYLAYGFGALLVVLVVAR
jgi:formate hydrogenlyase subunit 3/multisubunit Na+/H+ antiporter MnhD subunit